MEKTRDLSIIIMAAGKGTRMKSKLPKVLHKTAGKSMLDHVIDSAIKLNPSKIIVIVGFEAQIVIDMHDNRYPLVWAEQKEQLGTGHAVMQVIPHLKDYNGDVMILSGDVPLLSTSTMSEIYSSHLENNSNCTVLTTLIDNPYGYGRIVKNESGNVVKIVEQKDADENEKLIKEINSGTYCFDWKNLEKYLLKLTPQNAQGEYYLTDTIQMFVENSLKVNSYITADINQVLGVNDRATLAKVAKIMRTQINDFHMMNGITIIDPDTTYVDADIEIGVDSVIYPNTIIEGKSKIGSSVLLGPNTHIVNSTIDDNSEVVNSSITDSEIGATTKIGPFARIREHAIVGNNCKIGNFVELKKTVFSEGVKASHLAYIGDAEVGKETNIGAGTITCNYDGKRKHKTIMGENVFVGSNSTLVAPITLETDSYIAAGSVITEAVHTNELGVGRARQRNVENWVLRKKEKDNA